MRALVRRWAVDWLASHDPSTCDTLLTDDYLLTIGSARLAGRDAYVTGTMGQLRNYPGLVLTLHEVVSSGDHAAARFTEHGAAGHRDGAGAAWRGIALFERRGDAIAQCWAQEDYAARSRQLTSGVPDPVEAPALAPWDGPDLPPDPAAEAVVRSWLAAPVATAQIVRDDGGVDLDLTDIRTDVLFSAGPTVAFNGSCNVGGFALGVAGLLHVGADGELSGHIVTDRAGLAAHRKAQARG
jgi:hypothetical protein